MHRSLSVLLWSVTFLAAAGVVAPTIAQTKIPVEGSDRWLVQYADSTVSINDICPVAKKKLGTRKAPLYVNQRPVGFC
ncbi:MAG: hypothetical protein DHS20C21_11460 [Gemmatimonadota bacterium]|nr:MAG: hypothetical protein DHS20C21_11460 [Gemmatimonadota bacterium]